ncbi:uncharacterized protein LOC114579549 [Dendrobium catenatum]|uniref:uncharacterized protein LOC114579549 n=1 Tax=Dendrobium catenatum TaxID=906689 RepID=UPI00109FF2A1|nr:uncharacterized protein LOC114579549 [Dendrobium catenatum]
MFSTVIDVLEIILEDGLSSEQKGEAYALLESLQTFEFTFCLHLMKDILGITNELSQALQRGEQYIVNAMSLVRICNKRPQDMRDNKWTDFISNVTTFCHQQKIIVPHMDDKWVARGRSRRRAQDIINLYHFRVEIFYTVLGIQLQKLNNRFSEANTELLLCIACLNPNDGFHAFNKDKWVARGRSRRRAQDITNLYHFRVEIFYTVLDMQLQELNNRFIEANTILLLCIACLNPSDGFHAFNKDKLIQMTQLYPTDFSLVDRAVLENQLDTYIMDMRSDDQFTSLKDIGSLAEKMI